MRTPDPTKRLDQLTEGLEAAGFVVLDVVSAGKRTDVAVGSAGSGFWDKVTQSREWTEGYADPVNDYTARSIRSLIVEDKDEQAVFPFDSDAPNFTQFWPKLFPRLAQSDLGLIVHPEYGLWMGVRAHIILPVAYFKFDHAEDFDPCPSCTDKPCLSACPIGAFRGPRDYDVQACGAHLKSDPDCFFAGCDARAACPYGQSWQLSKDQAQYHQTRFRSHF